MTEEDKEKDRTLAAEQLLAKLARQAEEAELYELRTRATPVVFHAGELESAKREERWGLALRLIKEGRLGYSTATATSADPRGLDELVENALAAAIIGEEAPAGFHLPAPRESPPVECFDPEVAELQVQVERLIEMGEEVVERIKACDDTLQINVSLSCATEEVRLWSTAGQRVEERGTLVRMAIGVQRTEEGDILVVYDETGSRTLKEVDHLKLADSIVERLRWAERLAQVRSGRMPVLFTPRGVAVLLLPLVVGFDGKAVYLGISPLRGRLGEEVVDPRLTLLDDGRLPFAPLSRRYDDEGVPTARKALIDRGRIGQFLYDLKTAALAGAEPTGNGFKRRGLFNFSEPDYKAPPSAGPTTLVVGEGDRGFAELLEELDEGLIVDQVLGLGQGNVISGEFSNNVAVGYLVKGGEVVGRVKNTMIAGNVYELLKDRLIAIGERSEPVWGLFRSPPLLVDGVSVVSR